MFKFGFAMNYPINSSSSGNFYYFSYFIFKGIYIALSKAFLS